MGVLRSPLASRELRTCFVRQPGLGRLLALVLLALGLLLGACGSKGAPAAPAPAPLTERCPARMVAVPGTSACMDRHEARIEHGKAVPATHAPAASDLSWFDAERACRAADLRLCSLEEFQKACAGSDRARKYPYGDTHLPRRCNIAESTDDLNAVHVVASGTFPECRSPEGVFDLSGNAIEWLDDEGSGGGLRGLRGGSAFQPGSSATCTERGGGWRRPEEPVGGFRCCLSYHRRATAPTP